MLLVVGHVVDRARDICRDGVPAEFFLCDLLAERALHHGRACGENLAGVLHHHRPVRQDRAARRTACRRAEHSADHRHLAHQLHGALEAVHAREDRMAPAVDGGDAAAGTVDQVHERQAVLVSQVLDKAALPALLAVAAPTGAAAHREVLAANGDRAVADRGQPHHVGRWRHANQHVALVAALARELAHLLERARIDQSGDALADGQPSLLVVPGHGRLATQLLGLRPAKAQLSETGIALALAVKGRHRRWRCRCRAWLGGIRAHRQPSSTATT